MTRRRILASLAAVSALAAAASGGAQAPRISKPRPAPPGPSTMPPLPPAVFDDALNIGGNDVDARQVSTRLAVDVHVNGRGPYRFIVDSGADTSVVGQRIARDLQLPLGRPVILNSMTARHVVDRVRVSELMVGNSKFRDLELPALREGDVGGDGMIGIDALVNQRLMMDFENSSIKVEDGSTPYKARGDEIVIVARRFRGQLIMTQVNAAGLPLEAVIDTGSEITIGNSALREKLIRTGRDKVWTVPTTGVTGTTVNLQLARIDHLRLGPVTLQNVYVAFADLPPFKVFGLSDKPALLLGTDILETFRRVSLDFKGRKVRFQLRKCGSMGVKIATGPTSGLTRLSAEKEEACRR